MHAKTLHVVVHEQNNYQAKKFLQKLGGFHELFRRAMCRILEIRSIPRASPESVRDILRRLKNINNFLQNFAMCLTPPPDPVGETKVLMGLANHTLKESRDNIAAILRRVDPMDLITLNDYDILIHETDVAGWWRKLLQNESPAERQQRFDSSCRTIERNQYKGSRQIRAQKCQEVYKRAVRAVSTKTRSIWYRGNVRQLLRAGEECSEGQTLSMWFV
jgi:hypothetical protein